MEDNMAQQQVEVILARHLAENLALPIFIVDPQGNLIFFNEPAEAVLGLRFGDTGLLPASEWSVMFEPVDKKGSPIPPAELPLVIAMTQSHPAHKKFWIRSLDDELRQIELTAFPLIGQSGQITAAVAIFWEVTSEG
jgi:PAS domain-containing protein